MSQAFFEISSIDFKYDGIGLSNFLSNGIFVTLFISMTLYWVEIAFKKSKNQAAFAYAQAEYAESFSGEKGASHQSDISSYLDKKGSINSRFFLIIANFLLVFLLVLRWQISGHFPLSNLYESLIFLSWCCTFLHLIICQNLGMYIEKIVGAIISPSALLLTAFANLTLPKEMQQAAPLVPALQSNWLMMHVTVMIISYATLIVGSLLSIAFLIISFTNNFTTSSEKGTLQSKKNSLLLPNNKINLLINLDYLSYRIIGLGFPFLTIGILSGAVWANEAWGSYWSWDPKETWALLTWLVFAIYLHTRLNEPSKSEVSGLNDQTLISGAMSDQQFDSFSSNLQEPTIKTSKTFNLNKKPALIASLGFFVVWFCYLGVNLLGEGLHSYGFFA